MCRIEPPSETEILPLADAHQQWLCIGTTPQELVRGDKCVRLDINRHNFSLLSPFICYRTRLSEIVWPRGVDFCLL